MKILFFLALLTNIIVFLWEYNSTAVDTADIKNGIDNNADKQILLVSELSTEKQQLLLVEVGNTDDRFDPVVLSKVDTVSDKENIEIDRLVKEASNLVISKNFDNQTVMNLSENLYEAKMDQNKVEHRLITSKTINTVKQKAFVLTNSTTEKKNLKTDSKFNATHNTISEQKNSEVSHPVEENKFSITSVNIKDKSKKIAVEEILSKSKINSKEKKGSKLKKIDVVNQVKESKQQFVVNETNSNANNDQSKKETSDVKIKQKISKPDISKKVEEKGLVLADNKVDENKSFAVSHKIPKDLNTKANKPQKNNVSSTKKTKVVVEPVKKLVTNVSPKKINTKKDKALLVKSSDKGKAKINGLLTKIEQPKVLSKQCYDIGPFENLTAFDVWRKQNKIDLASTRMHKKNTSKSASYLVYYPPAKNFSESKKNVQILKRMGITDYWLFLKGELKGAISLGLFTKESRALRFKEKLGNKGLEVNIKQRDKTETRLFTQIITEDKKFRDTVGLSKLQMLSECKTQ